MKKYSLYQLQWRLPEMEDGDRFKITGQLEHWELYDKNRHYFFIRNCISKQIIAIQKLRD